VGTEVLELFRDLAQREGKGLVIVTHDPKVRKVADRVVGIRDGKLTPMTESARDLGAALAHSVMKTGSSISLGGQESTTL
jgi:ABC-type lipoprotein export system ATPase subunit